MAETTPTASTYNGTGYSCFQRTVTLYDWWLVKSQKHFQGKCVAISGVSSRKGEVVRVFNSAPIIKRYDEFSLETVDGIYMLSLGVSSTSKARWIMVLLPRFSRVFYSAFLKTGKVVL
ncbi:unnamed protein product [Trifolium pratense]|uniref:Uncharacterized protein n=1 Tax=Trifolium pratense TaxID=57577 RepID=A0ACB0JR79_TRIPR|nr:unnamed protein product [Trifolium pratense]